MQQKRQDQDVLCKIPHLIDYYIEKALPIEVFETYLSTEATSVSFFLLLTTSQIKCDMTWKRAPSFSIPYCDLTVTKAQMKS